MCYILTDQKKKTAMQILLYKCIIAIRLGYRAEIARNVSVQGRIESDKTTKLPPLIHIVDKVICVDNNI